MPTPAHGLYVHIPFCARRCDYCDFFIVPGRLPRNDEPGSDFFATLARDLAVAAGDGSGRRIRLDTIYFGGGTPSFVEPARIESVMALSRRLFDVEPGAEATLEANPESVTPERARLWLTAGITRLSLGVQSMADRVLAPRGRSYTASQAIEAGRCARREGFSNLGVDLILGLPGESSSSFREGLEQVVSAIAPAHVSIYMIETEEAGKLTGLTRAIQEGRERLMPDDEIVRSYLDAIDRLETLGYRHYEISNFCRPGFESRHNMKYWTGQPYLGVGPSAHSLAGGRRFGRPDDFARWADWVRQSESGSPVDAADYTLNDKAARAREALVLELRMIEGVSLVAFEATWGPEALGGLVAAIADLTRDGLLAASGGRLALTRRGLPLANEVFSRLV